MSTAPSPRRLRQRRKNQFQKLVPTAHDGMPNHSSHRKNRDYESMVATSYESPPAFFKKRQSESCEEEDLRRMERAGRSGWVPMSQRSAMHRPRTSKAGQIRFSAEKRSGVEQVPQRILTESSDDMPEVEDEPEVQRCACKPLLVRLHASLVQIPAHGVQLEHFGLRNSVSHPQKPMMSSREDSGEFKSSHDSRRASGHERSKKVESEAYL